MNKLIAILFLTLATTASAFVQPRQKNPIFAPKTFDRSPTELSVALNIEDAFRSKFNAPLWSNNKVTVIDPDYKLASLFAFAAIFIYFLYPGENVEVLLCISILICTQPFSLPLTDMDCINFSRPNLSRLQHSCSMSTNPSRWSLQFLAFMVWGLPRGPIIKGARHIHGQRYAHVQFLRRKVCQGTRRFESRRSQKQLCCRWR